MKGLSRRETQVIQRLASGKRVVEIASEWGISVPVVRNYVVRARRKRHVESQADLVSTWLPTQDEEETLP